MTEKKQSHHKQSQGGSNKLLAFATGAGVASFILVTMLSVKAGLQSTSIDKIGSSLVSINERLGMLESKQARGERVIEKESKRASLLSTSSREMMIARTIEGERMREAWRINQWKMHGDRYLATILTIIGEHADRGETEVVLYVGSRNCASGPFCPGAESIEGVTIILPWALGRIAEALDERGYQVEVHYPTTGAVEIPDKIRVSWGVDDDDGEGGDDKDSERSL